MATHEISIIGPQTIPDTSGSVWQEPYTIAATNDVWGLLVYRFKDTATRIGLHGGFVVPQNYVGTAVLVIYWTSTATSGDVEWDFDYRAITGNDSESLDQTSNIESVNGNDTAPGAAHRQLIFTINLTGTNIAAGDFVEFTLFRDGTDGGDTMAADALLFDALFRYADA
jgi:hypothetical protein